MTNTNALKAINNSILELTNTSVANLGGVVTVAAGSTLDLDTGASISDGTLGNSGEVNAEGTTALHHLGITNSGTLESTGGVLTIDAGSSITNSGTLQANGGELDLTGDTVTNTNALKATGSGTLKLTGTTVTNSSGTVTVDTGSTLTMGTSTITGGLVTSNTTSAINLNGLAVLANGSLSNLGQISINGTGNALHQEAVTANSVLEIMAGGALLADLGSTIANGGGTVKVDASGTLTLNSATITGGTVANNGTIYAITTVDISGNIIGTGVINVANLAELEIGGSVASTNTVFFSGSQGELILDHAKQFSGLITGSSLGTELTPGDQIDLQDLPFISSFMKATVSYNAILNVSTVTFSDGNHTNDVAIKLSGNYTDDGWDFANDGFGGTIVELASIDHWINSAGGSWTVSGNWSAGVPTSTTNVAIDASGTYTVTSPTSVDINSMVVASGATLLTKQGTVFTVEGSVINNGEIDAGPFSENKISTIDIKGDVTGTGLFAISNKAVIEFGGSVAAGETVLFDAGQGTLVLDHAAQFHGLIESSASGTPLSTGNLIDLKDLSFTSSMTFHVDYSSATNISSVAFSNGTTTITLQVLGNDSNWHLQSDGHGGTTVFDPPLTTIDSGTSYEITGASAESVTFANVSSTTGALVLDDSSEFIGFVTGFTGDGTLANSDSIDLKDIAFSSQTTASYIENSDSTGWTLTLSDGMHTANLNFAGADGLQSFTLSDDGSGGTMIINPQAKPADGAPSGTAVISGNQILDVEAPSTANIVFASAEAATLKLGDAFHFNGTIAGFAGADVINLANVGFGAASLSYHENVGGTGGTLTISDGVHLAELSLVGNYSADNFNLAPDLLKGTAITYLAHDLVV